jgi:hypothetical protein
MLRLVGASLSDDFSVPLLAAAVAAAVGWVVIATLAAIARRPPRIRASAATMEIPGEAPPVAGLLVNDFVVPAESAPAILLDLAARRVVELEEVQPGRTICRVRASSDEPLISYERRVLDNLRRKAIDGVIPTEALTTGPETQSKGWHRGLAREIVDEAKARGLTYDRWPKPLVAVLGFILAIAGLLAGLSLKSKTHEPIDEPPILLFGVIAVGVAFIVVAAALVARMGQSLAQLPTDAGREAAARAEGLERHLRDAVLADLPPAAVKLRGRQFAYAAAFGLAPLAVALLPMGTEDEHRAWSRFGGKWRRVRVRYPRAWPPAHGKHPGFALLLALFWGALAIFAIMGLAELVDDPWTGITDDTWEWVERAGYLAMIPFALVLAWACFVLVHAVPDLTATREITGDIVRARRYQQIFTSRDNPSYWFYFAVDDGSTDRIRALRVRPHLWSLHSQGQTVTAQITPRLGYVRSMNLAGAPTAVPVGERTS